MAREVSIMFVLISMALLLAGCNENMMRETHASQADDEVVGAYRFKTYNYCKENLLFDDHVTGNTIVRVTPHNNFMKITALNDTQYVFSCGKGRIEVELSSVKCGNHTSIGFDGFSFPKLQYDDEDVMILYSKAGSDSWLDYFVCPRLGKVYTAQALYIDSFMLKYVYLERIDTNVSFIVHDIMPDVRDTLNSKYYKFRDDGDPFLHIQNVLLSNDTLYYEVATDSGVVKDTLVK